MPSLRYVQIIIMSALLIVNTLPCSASGQEQKIRQLIESSEIVPMDYRKHVNIVAHDDTVLISVFRDPDAQENDCKIDAILMSEKVTTAVPSVRSVSVFFYSLGSDDRLWQVDVPTSSVAAFAQGSLDKSGILRAVKLSFKQANTLANSYAGQSYKEIVQHLGVFEGPLQDQRAQALVRIDELAARGKDTVDLKRNYLHVEDLTRRGDRNAAKTELKKLTFTLSQLADDDRDAKLNSLSASAGGSQVLNAGRQASPARAAVRDAPTEVTQPTE